MRILSAHSKQQNNYRYHIKKEHIGERLEQTEVYLGHINTLAARNRVFTSECPRTPRIFKQVLFSRDFLV